MIQSFENPESLSADEKDDYEKKLSVYFLVMEWVKSVIAYQLEFENQLVHQNHRDVTRLMAMKNKKEMLQQLCPDLIFPGYNEVSH